MPLRYRVLAEPLTHLYHVEAQLEGESLDGARWVLPTWTPGSYVLREYAGQVLSVSAEADGQAVDVVKRDKTTWELSRSGRTVRLRYSVYAHELTVRTSFLDDVHGYINGAAGAGFSGWWPMSSSIFGTSSASIPRCSVRSTTSTRCTRRRSGSWRAAPNYAVLLLGRAGLVPTTEVLDTLAARLHRSETRPGNREQSLEEASFDAWIKHYRPHAGSSNSTVSYYEKGSLPAWLLDLKLRQEAEGRASLDLVLRILWDRFPEGFPEDAPGRVVEELGGPLVLQYLEAAVHERRPLDLSPLASVGLDFVTESSDCAPDTGIEGVVDAGALTVRTVRATSGAEAAGIAPGDRILTVDGLEMGRAGLTERLRWYAPGDHIRVHLFRDGVLLLRTVALGPPRADKARLVPLATVDERTRAAFAAWMGQPHPFRGPERS